ncbi:MAG: baseplate J/gp47 family protein [Roseburia sp.]|nr:baseplate J/gp47 family protein [Roseburia sp.]
MADKWTNPKRRSFQAIRQDMVAKLTSFTDSEGNQLITDISEGNILIIILSLFAGIAEMLHFYIDNMARESFLSTARRYDSVAAIGDLVDYKGKAANAATVDVVLTRQLDGANTQVQKVIPKGTIFTDSRGNTWMVTEDTAWGANLTKVTVPCIQHKVCITDAMNNKLTGTTGNTINLAGSNDGEQIEQGTVSLYLGGEAWTEVDTFAYSGPTDKHFRLIYQNGYFLQFGDGKFGKTMPSNKKISVTYYLTKGTKGNIDANAITTVPDAITTMGKDVKASNPYATADGLDVEGIELLRSHIGIHTRTMGMAITKQDFVDIAKLVPGVKDAAVEYICGRKLDLYISPGNSDGTGNSGIASSALCTKVLNYLKERSPLTTWINVYAAGIAKINLEIEVTGRPSFSANEIKTSIENALFEAYSYAKAQIGGKVRISDIYAMIDNLPGVDYLYIKKFFVSPWPKIIYGDTQLQMSFGTNGIEKASGRVEYLIVFSAQGTWDIYSKVGGYVHKGITADSYRVEDYSNGMVFNLTLKNRTAIKEGSKYSITISEPNMDYDEPGYNQVVFDDATLLNLKIRETV